MPRRPGQEKPSAPLHAGGRVKLRLIRELAEGRKPQLQLSREYGVSQSAISQFAKRHSAEIERVRENIGDQFSHLWVADKAERLASYQTDIDEIDARLSTSIVEALKALEDAADNDEERERRAELLASLLKDSPTWVRVKHKALRQVAEEVGQLPTRHAVQLGDVRVTHVLEGVNIDDV